MLEVPDIGYEATIGEAIRRAAEQWGDQDFLVMPDRRVTYREAEEASRALAKRMVAAGIGKGTRFGMFDTYSIDWVIVWLAAVRVGALVMPFSSIYKPAELRKVLLIGDVDTLWAPASFLGKDVPAYLEEAVPGLDAAGSTTLFLPELPYLRRIWITGDIDRSWATPLALGADAQVPADVSDELFAAVEAEVVPADLAQVTYTSGSSALPKGVVHSHGAIIRSTKGFADNRAALVGDASTAVLCAFPFFWIGGTLVLGGALQSGFTVCFLERFEPAAALDLIEREGISSVLAWPSLIQSLKAHPSYPSRDLSGIPSLTVGPSDIALIGTPLPGVPAHRGMSETVGNWYGSERKIVDPDSDGTDAQPDMVEGELWIRGFGVMQGYYKKEREEVFDADAWFHTGDRCFMFENKPYFVGRFYEMIKSQGANVSPREVELMLEGFPEVEHALVFGAPHPELEEEVTAVIVFKPGMRLTADELRERALKEVSSFKVPTRIEVIEDEDDIPWLASGKPDKLTLAARYLGGAS